jgi:tetratricopeptide (TPR) repeat protein
VLQDCVAVGYPLWQLDPAEGQRNAAELHGNIRVTEDVESGLLVLRDSELSDVMVPPSVEGEDLSAESPWGGLSGALVFYRDAALGVVVEHHPRKGPSAITIMPVARFASDRGQSAELAATLALSPGVLRLVEPPVDGGGRSVGWPHRVGVVPLVADGYQTRAASQTLAAGRGAGGTVVVTGLGGTGKTQLVAAEAEASWASGMLDLVVWVTASSRASVVTGLAKAAWDVVGGPPEATVEDRAEQMVAWLAGTGRRWLVVLDDVRDPADLAGLWLAGPTGRMLLTTSRRDATLTGAGRQLLEIESFSPAEAAGYLTARLGPSQLGEAAELADDLGRLPLALAQAASYILDRGLTCSAYRRRFARRRLEIALPADAAADSYPAIVATTWDLSLQAANTSAPVGLAAPTLNLAALLDPNGIPIELFTTHSARIYLAAATAVRSGEPSDEIDVDDAGDCVQLLRRFSLATINSSAASATTTAGEERESDLSVAATVRVHALVQRVTRENLPTEQLTRAGQAAADALIEIWPDSHYTLAQAQLAQSLRDSASLLETHCPDVLWTNSGAHPLPIMVGQSLAAAGLLTETVHFYERLAARSEDVLGGDHPETLSFWNSLALAYQEVGRVEDAVTLFERILPQCARIRGRYHPDTLTNCNNLARAYLAAGRLEDAVALLEATLAYMELVLDDNDPVSLTIRNNLAGAYRAVGRLDDALVLKERTLVDRERMLGADHPDTLMARNNLASAYRDGGRLNDALDLFESTLPSLERVLGPDHPLALVASDNLAGAYQDVGRLDDAMTLYERTLAERERILGADHPDTLTTRNNLANAYRDVERPHEAVVLLEGTMASYERLFGADHPDALTIRNNLAGAYQEDGRLDDAIALFERTLADRERVLGPDHPAVLVTCNNLANAYQDVGQVDEAIALLESTMASQERLLGADHPDTLTVRFNLAGAYREVGRLDDAIALFERTLADRERVLGPDHPATIASGKGVAMAYRAAGRLDEALPLLERAVADSERRLGTEHTSVAAILYNLASIQLALGDPTRATTSLKRAVAIDEAAFGPEHPEVATDLEALAHVQQQNNNPSEAIASLRRALRIRSGTDGADSAEVADLRERIAVLDSAEGGSSDQTPNP